MSSILTGQMPFDFSVVISRPKTDLVGQELVKYVVDYNPSTQLPNALDAPRMERTHSYCCKDNSTGIFNKDEDQSADDSDWN